MTRAVPGKDAGGTAPHATGVCVGRSSGRAHAYVTAPWSPEVLATLVEQDVAALTLLAASEVRSGDGLAGLERLTSLRALEVEWSRAPAIPEQTLGQVEDLCVTGRSGARLPLGSLREVRSLEFRPGRAVGALAEVPHLEAASTRGMPEQGMAAFEGCARLRVIRLNGRGVTELRRQRAPASVESIIVSGIALTSLDGVRDLPHLNDLTLASGRQAAGTTLDLAPLAGSGSLRAFAAEGYAAYTNAGGLSDRLAYFAIETGKVPT